MPIRPVDIKKTDLQKLPNGMNAVGYVPGLNLYVRGPSSKQWIFRHTCKVCRTKHKVSIGIFPQDSLDDAVTNAYAARSKVGQGVCLKGEKYKEQKRIEVDAQQAITFSEALDEFWPSIQKGLSDRKAYQWKSTLDYYVVPKIGNERIVDLKTKKILEVLTQKGEAADKRQMDNFWLDRTKVAQDVRQRMEKIISMAIAYHELDVANPAAKANGLGELLPKQNRAVLHHKSLAWESAPAFWQLFKNKNTQSQKVLKILALTGKRVSEVTEMTWGELDLESGLWTIPWQRLLKKQVQEDHREPLSDLAIEILRSQPRDGDFVFQSGNRTPLSDTAIRKQHRRWWKGEKVDTHGFRGTIRTFFYDNDQLGFSKEHVEVMLTHGQSKLDAAYQRGDGYRRRKKMMQVWADYMAGKLEVP
jgi:integrase